jgi:hypothetical protein
LVRHNHANCVGENLLQPLNQLLLLCSVHSRLRTRSARVFSSERTDLLHIGLSAAITNRAPGFRGALLRYPRGGSPKTNSRGGGAYALASSDRPVNSTLTAGPIVELKLTFLM